MNGTSLIDNLLQRQIDSSFNKKFRKLYVFSKSNIKHLSLDTELKGHEGCVNCLEWNHAGTLLASGSDDLKLNIWNPFQKKLVKSIDTRHRGNIFSAKFLPGTNDSLIATAAADNDIYVYDLTGGCYLNEIHSHSNRVKKLATVRDIPFLFWSCGEDGLILQHDIRCPSTEITKLVINYAVNSTMEGKCLALNEMKPELLAVGSSDPYARVYDRRMIKLVTHSSRTPDRHNSSMDYSSSSNTSKHLFEYTLENEMDLPLTYYTPGHLPKRILEYKKRMKTLSITHLSFSPDGTELLVNLGGEQLYLFDVVDGNYPSNNTFKYNSFRETLVNIEVPGNACESTETTGTEKNSKKKKHKLSPRAEELKTKANACFEQANYVEAIEFYNLALEVAPESPILYGNRAASLMKRNWDGDNYMAMLDCYKALNLDKMHLKSHFRLVRCLFELKWLDEAKECFDIFIERFPEYANSDACDRLLKEIDEALFKLKEKSGKNEESETTSSDDSDNEFNQFLTKRKKSDSSKSGSDTNSLKSNEDEDLNSEANVERRKQRAMVKKYQKAKENAVDIKRRYCGHCNVSTDIKEACFLGTNYISAGSDDGSFFIWDKTTTNVVRVLRGDESIVNCIQPHPFDNIIATSGIDPLVRIWTPQMNEETVDERVVTNVKEAAINNQRQMNSHPFEFLLLNLAQSQNANESQGTGQNNAACRPS